MQGKIEITLSENGQIEADSFGMRNSATVHLLLRVMNEFAKLPVDDCGEHIVLAKAMPVPKTIAGANPQRF